MELEEVDHSGSGDFTLEVFDMDTKTHANSVTMSYDGEEYLTRKTVDLEMVLNMDLNEFKFTFKENVAKVNDFSMGFDGWFSMPDENMHMDIGFGTKNNSFKSLLSLVPGAYTADFADIKTSGSLQFDGFVRGTYNATEMPAFNFNMKVADGMFQYPDLPTAVTNITWTC